MATRRACDICYRRKIQCSIPSPGGPCNWCGHHGKDCTFNRASPRKSSRRSRVTLGHVQELLQRIRQLEDAQGSPSTEETASPISTHTDGTVICTDDQGDSSPGAAFPSRAASADIVNSIDTVNTIDTDNTVNTIFTDGSVGTASTIDNGSISSLLFSPATTITTTTTTTTTNQLDRLARHRPRIGSSTNHPASLTTGCDGANGSLAGASPRIHPLRYCMGPNWFFNGIPIFTEEGRQWLATRTGQTVDWTRFRIINSCPTNPLDASLDVCCPSAFAEHGQLPVGKEVAQRVLDIYASSSFRLFFPVLEPTLMQATIETAYEPTDETPAASSCSSQHIASRACVLAALSVLGRLQRCNQVILSSPASSYVDTDWYANRAHSLIQGLAGDMSLETLQTVLLLYLQRMSSGRWQEAVFLLSTACRIVSALGGHIYRPPGPSGTGRALDERRECHIRQLFWLCYMLDKDVSLRTGHIPLLTDEYCDLTVPENYTDCYAQLQWLTEFWDSDEEEGAPASLHPLVPHLPSDPQLSILKERVYRLLFSARSLRSTDGLLVHIRRLDVELEQWRQSVPAAFRPMLAIPTTAPLLAAQQIPQQMHYVYLQLEYHQLITVIHTTVRRYSSSSSRRGYVRKEGVANTSQGDSDEERAQNFHTVIHSSVDLSLEASRSTLWCLAELIARLGARAYQFIVFYPTTAAVSLFLNMVIHPLDDEAQLDVERLVAAANVIRNMPTQDLTASEAERIKDMSNFILGLVWLGTSAITGATSKK